jgi:hypothetical protein
MKLAKLPGTDLWVNPHHVVYIERMTPFDKGIFAGMPRVEVCITMYGRYRTENVFNTTAAEVAAIINEGEIK